MTDPLTQSDDLSADYLSQRQVASSEDVIARARARVAAGAAEKAPAEGAAAVTAATDAAGKPGPDWSPFYDETGTRQIAWTNNKGLYRFINAMPSATAALGTAAGTVAKDVGGGLVEAPRQALGGISDAVHNAAMGMSHLGDWLNTHVADLTIPIPKTGSDTVDQLLADPAKAIAGQPNEISPAETTTGGIIRDTARFLTGFLPVFKGMKALGAGPIVSSVVAGGLEGATAEDPLSQGLANLIKAHPALQNPVSDFLAADPTDNEAVARLKKGLEGAGVGAAAEGLTLAVRAMRAATLAGKRPSEVVDTLAQQKAQYGELGDRDFMILGDPTAPALQIKDVESTAEAQARVKGEMAAAERQAERGPSAGDLSGAGAPPNVGGGPSAGKVSLERLSHQDASAIYERVPNSEDNHYFLVKGADGEPSAFLWLKRDGENLHVEDIVSVDRIQSGNISHIVPNPFDPQGTIGAAGMRDVLRRIKAAFPDAKTLSGVRTSGARFGGERVDIRDGKEASIDLAGIKSSSAEGSGGSETFAGSAGGKEVYVNFAKINTPEDVQKVMGQMADAFAGDLSEATRGVQSNEETARLAEQLGMSVGDLLARRKGQPFNAEQAVAARSLWAASAEKLLETAKAAAAPNAGAVDQFNFRRMMAIHYAVQAEVIGARTETARALQSWSMPVGGGVEKAKQIQDLLAQMGGPDFSKAMAQRLAILEQSGAGPEALNQFVRKTWAQSSWDVVQEAWVNALLSSPKTHIVNTVSNLGAALTQIVERSVASDISGLRGNLDGVAPNEAAAMAYGLVTGLKDAWRLAWQSVKTGETGSALGKVEGGREPAINGDWLRDSGYDGTAAAVDYIGKATRVPTRMLGAEDEFFKSIAYRMELHAQSMRQAYGEGLRGEEMGYRMAEIMANPPENIRMAAADAALYTTFTNATGNVGQALSMLRQKVPVVAFIMPFVKTPVNIARYSFERSPLAPLVGQWRADIAAGGARRDLALARMATGTTIMMLAADYADKGLVSGAGPHDTAQRETQARQGWQPYSVKIGKRWYSYNRLDPLGMTMGLAADFTELMKRGEVDPEKLDEANEIIGGIIAAISNTVVNKTYMQGTAQFFQMVEDGERYAPAYVSQFMASFVPAGVNVAEQINDPVRRETMKMFDAAQAKLPVLASMLTPRMDLWGKEVAPSSGYGSVYDALSPVPATQEVNSPIDAEMQRLGLGIARIGKKTDWDGVPVNFRDWPQVYKEYVQRSGNTLKHPAWGMGAEDFLDAVVGGKHDLSEVYKILSDGKDGGKAQFIQRTISEYRKSARDSIGTDPRFADFMHEVAKGKDKKAAAKMPNVGGGIQLPAH